nr:MAG TPA: hypothetical protein [Caudoviricetes sp.]
MLGAWYTLEKRLSQNITFSFNAFKKLRKCKSKNISYFG